MPDSFTTYILNRDGLAITLDDNYRTLRVKPRVGTFLPEGFSICKITVEPAGPVAEFQALGDETIYGRMRKLAQEWKKEYQSFEWERDAQREPFVSLDIESDGARIWEAALIPSDEATPYLSYDKAVHGIELQMHLDRLLPGHILVGHNIREWDIAILKRHGIRINSDVEIWDTLEKEQELCNERQRPSYALQTRHNAESDARKTLELARNQWLRRHAPPAVAAKAWSDSDAFFIIPCPQWAEHDCRFEIAKHAWKSIEEAYQRLDSTAVEKQIERITWHVFAPSRQGDTYDPFNPASPKRIDYWYRILPAIEAVRRDTRTVLFVQYEQEIARLVEVIPNAFTGDPRRCVRTLEEEGGLLILHESQWNRTLAEGLPDHTTVLLEKMPESVRELNQPVVESDDTEEAEDQSDAVDEVAESLMNTSTAKSLPDLQQLGKMALWQQKENLLRFVCLDARLWNMRSEAPFACETIAPKWSVAISREKLERAGFRQTTDTFHLPDAWEQEICSRFGVKELHPFQRSKLARILQRDGLACEYIERATGGGKSLIFQAAALYRGITTGRLTVVISPLRALIHDQVHKLHDRGFALDVEALSGDMSRIDIEEAYRRIAGGETKLVYTAPERFRSKAFLHILETRFSLDAGGQPEFWVFDEAHCISLWGLEFRPDYRKAADYICDLSKKVGPAAAPVLLVSATLTRLAKDDIETVLGFKK